MRLTMKERRTVTKALCGQYRKAGKRARGRIWDHFLEATGYNRHYAAWLLRHHGKRVGEQNMAHSLLDVSGAIERLPELTTQKTKFMEASTGTEPSHVALNVAPLSDMGCVSESLDDTKITSGMIKTVHDATCRIANNDRGLHTVTHAVKQKELAYRLWRNKVLFRTVLLLL